MITLITNGHPLSEGSIKSLKGYLEDHYIPVRAIYLSHTLSLYPALIRDIVSMIQDSVLVGFSLMSKDVRIFTPLIRRIRQEDIPVIMGGIHATALPQDSLEQVDYICRGEGEEPLRLLYEMLCGLGHIREIPNIGYHSDDGPVIQPVTWSPQDLDKLPTPDTRMLNSFLLTSYKEGRRLVKIPLDPVARARFFHNKGFMFYSQRGCRLACTYCSNSLYRDLLRESSQRWYRTLTVARIKEQLRDHMNFMPWVRHITINDDDFLDRDIEELREIGRYLRDNLHITFNINATPRHVTPEKIDLLASYGLREVAMGVQTGSERILKEIYHRPVPPDHIINAAQTIHQYSDRGIKITYGFILDNPYESEQDWLASLRLLSALPRPRHIMLYSLTWFPGTNLTRRACDEAIIPGPDIDCDKMYHDDIYPTYAWFLFLISSRYQIPDRIHRILTSRLIVFNPLTAPFRWFCGYSIYLLTLRTRLTKIYKQGYDILCRFRTNSFVSPTERTALDPLPNLPGQLLDFNIEQALTTLFEMPSNQNSDQSRTHSTES